MGRDGDMEGGATTAWLVSAERAGLRRRGARLGWAVVLPGLVVVALAHLNDRQVAEEAAAGRALVELATRAEIAAEDGARGARIDRSLASSHLDELGADAPAGAIDDARAALEVARLAEESAEDDLAAAVALREGRYEDLIRAVRRSNEARSMALVASFLFGTVVSVGGIVVWAGVLEERRSFLARRALAAVELESREQERALWGEGGDPHSHDAAWAANRARMEGYHQLVMGYASSTRQLTQAALVIGMVFVGGLAVLALLTNDTASAVATSAIGVAGTGFAGFVTKAILRNAEASSREVLAFSTQPLEVERILRALRIVDSMPDEERAQAQLVIVEALVSARPNEPGTSTTPGAGG